jgi:hypothetical protein
MVPAFKAGNAAFLTREESLQVTSIPVNDLFERAFGVAPPPGGDQP